jgi:hypothetical protein
VLCQLHAAVRQIEVAGDATQLEAAAHVLVQARQSLYLILAGKPRSWRVSEGCAFVGACARFTAC